MSSYVKVITTFDRKIFPGEHFSLRGFPAPFISLLIMGALIALPIILRSFKIIYLSKQKLTTNLLSFLKMDFKCVGKVLV